MIITKKLAGLVVLGALCAASLGQAADDFPSRSIRIVVAYSAGGGNDLVARLLAARLSEQMGKTVFVENRAGASGIVGTEIPASISCRAPGGMSCGSSWRVDCGIGGDPIIGTTHIDALEAFEADPDTDAIVMIGEIGGDAEERAAAYIVDHVTKPVVGYVAGFTAPEGKTMGHAGAIVSGSSGTAEAKKDALEAAGVRVGKTPSATAQLLHDLLGSAH